MYIKLRVFAKLFKVAKSFPRKRYRYSDVIDKVSIYRDIEFEILISIGIARTVVS